MRDRWLSVVQETQDKKSNLVKKKVRSPMDVESMGDMIALMLYYLVLWLRWIKKGIKHFSSKKSVSATPTEKPVNTVQALITRLEKKERLDPHCKYADCLIALPNCTMLEQCLISQLKKVR